MNGPQTTRRPVTRLSQGAVERLEDEIAVERPLEMRIEGRPLTVTLRTPGRDRELGLGFLAGEGLIRRPEDVRAARETPAACGDEPFRLADHVPDHAPKLRSDGPEGKMGRPVNATRPLDARIPP